MTFHIWIALDIVDLIYLAPFGLYQSIDYAVESYKITLIVFGSTLPNLYGH